ncbi:Sodium/calcium exchanger protein-domain-containing protein [Xylariomycetidae sp. FL2044]|nr:Sodium/calcium exchanger protein-domain-containing protein [Xylariomycetidae sp. FL2044]
MVLERFNLFKVRSTALRVGRHAPPGKFSWFNVWQRFDWRKEREADIEEAKPSNEGDTHNPPATAASHSSGEENNPELPDSQSIDRPETNSEGGVTRRHTAKVNGSADSDTHPQDQEEIPKQHSGLFREAKSTEKFTFKNQFQRVVLAGPINLLLLAAPAGIVIWALGLDGRIAFAVNFIAIIPLAALLSDATEEIAMRTGEVLGGLINATFGNAVELIVAIIALANNEVTVVQTSLIGSILSNLLLVLGFCFFFGGINRKKQRFNQTVAQTAASLLALAIASLILPTVFVHIPTFYNSPEVTLDPSDTPNLSHGIAIILLFVYAALLGFQLHTHSELFNEQSEKTEKENLLTKTKVKNVTAGVANVHGASITLGNTIYSEGDRRKLNDAMKNPKGEDDEPEEPRLHFLVALGTLLVSTVIIALCAEGMVSGIDALTAGGTVSKEFVGLILIPIVGNACEHATAVTVAIKDKMDLAIGVAIGSSMQVALFLIPLLVIIGWGMGNTDMTLAFDIFQIVAIFFSVLLVNYLIADGESNWLEGFLLMCLYIIIAVCTWFYPEIPEDLPITAG